MSIALQAPEELLAAWVYASSLEDATVRAGRTDPAELLRWARRQRAEGVGLPYLEGETEYRGL